MPDSPGKSVMAGMPGIPVIPGAGPALNYTGIPFSARTECQQVHDDMNDGRWNMEDRR